MDYPSTLSAEDGFPKGVHQSIISIAELSGEMGALQVRRSGRPCFVRNLRENGSLDTETTTGKTEVAFADHLLH